MKEMVQNLLHFFPCKNLYSCESFHWGHYIKRSCKTETAFLSHMNSDFIKLTCGAAEAMKKWLRRWGGWRPFNFPQHRISRDIEERKWVWKAKQYSTWGSPWGLIALSPLAGSSLCCRDRVYQRLLLKMQWVDPAQWGHLPSAGISALEQSLGLFELL